MECNHKFVILKEAIATSKGILSGEKRMKIITLQCSICGRITSTEVRAGDAE